MGIFVNQLDSNTHIYRLVAHYFNITKGNTGIMIANITEYKNSST